jgi:hypothetical protein
MRIKTCACNTIRRRSLSNFLTEQNPSFFHDPFLLWSTHDRLRVASITPLYHIAPYMGSGSSSSPSSRNSFRNLRCPDVLIKDVNNVGRLLQNSCPLGKIRSLGFQPAESFLEYRLVINSIPSISPSRGVALTAYSAFGPWS